mmetsp:Transcript_65483/g.200552  ORF Transcript_65483/g.200552 Transcript_65483/m.200552 type:complete len:253 (+) Transcript_65483:776-1534(+)
MPLAEGLELDVNDLAVQLRRAGQVTLLLDDVRHHTERGCNSRVPLTERRDLDVQGFAVKFQRAAELAHLVHHAGQVAVPGSDVRVALAGLRDPDGQRLPLHVRGRAVQAAPFEGLGEVVVHLERLLLPSLGLLDVMEAEAPQQPRAVGRGVHGHGQAPAQGVVHPLVLRVVWQRVRVEVVPAGDRVQDVLPVVLATGLGVLQPNVQSSSRHVQGERVFPVRFVRPRAALMFPLGRTSDVPVPLGEAVGVAHR